MPSSVARRVSTGHAAPSPGLAMLFALLAPAFAAPTLDCATPQVLRAQRGLGPAPAASLAPRQLGPILPPPPGGGKVIYGTPYEDHLETENFTINWAHSGITEDVAVSAGEALETAWTAFIEEQDWIRPVSSDRFYLWVLLDPGLGSTTGYTTLYKTDLYPDGYPVIYLNPDWAWDEAFWAALAAHELMHALQFALRYPEGTTQETESWYWEASATWASELADPAVDGHQYTSEWYATQPDLRFDSLSGSHQYGIFVFNAWLEEYLTGPGGMKAAWELSADRPSSEWDAILAESTGVPAGELWAGFTGAYGNRLLEESELYTPARTEGTLAEGSSGSLPKLGSHYYRVEEDLVATVEGTAILGAVDKVGSSVELVAGDTLAVTGLADHASYSLSLEPVEVEPEDGGAEDGGAEDGGAEDGGAEDGGADGGATEPGDGAEDGEEDGAKASCSTAPARGSLALLLPAALLLLGRRRR